jgi:hypothetical protein
MCRTDAVEEIKTHILYSVFFFGNRALFEIMWKSKVERGRPQTTIWRMRAVDWIIKATDTQPQCVIFIAHPL